MRAAAADGLLLDLADALPGQIELFADFFQRERVLLVSPK